MLANPMSPMNPASPLNPLNPLNLANPASPLWLATHQPAHVAAQASAPQTGDAIDPGVLIVGLVLLVVAALGAGLLAGVWR